MIRTLQIRALRGVREASIEGFAPLTVLLGPNGSGKSTVIDALLIGAHPVCGDAIGRAVKRRPRAHDGARWLFGYGAIDVNWVEVGDGTQSRRVHLRRSKYAHPIHERELIAAGHPAPYSTVLYDVDGGSGEPNSDQAVTFSYDGTYAHSARVHASFTEFVRLLDIEMNQEAGIARAFDRLDTSAREQLHEALLPLLPPGSTLTLGVDDANAPFVKVDTAAGAFPLALAGEGIERTAQIAMGLSHATAGLVLLEEPESHLHPRALGQVAAVLVRAMERGVQLVVTTHSLELLDAILGELASAGRVQDLCLFRTVLRDGVLDARRVAGQEVLDRRGDLPEDLR